MTFAIQGQEINALNGGPHFQFWHDKDAAKTGRAMQAMMTMKKIDIAAIERAYEG